MSSSERSNADAVLVAAEALPYGVAITDVAGTITWTNAAYARLEGCTQEDLKGRSVGEFAFDELAHADPSAPPSWVEAARHRKNGEVYATRHTITTLRSPAGDVTGFWITLEDITGLRNEGDAPHSAGANLSALIESTEDLIWSVDLDYNLLTFNQAFQDNLDNTFGVRAVSGMRLEEWLAPERVRLWPPMYGRALSEGAFRTEYSMLNGRILELSFNPIRQDGRTTGVSVFGKDITQAKAAEKALLEAESNYRDIFEGALEGMFQVAPGKPLALNSALAHMLGYDSVQQALSAAAAGGTQQAWLDLNERARFVKLLADQGIVRGYECRFKRKDGSLIWVSFNVRRIAGPDGQAPTYRGFIEDITERKQMQEALRKSEEKFAKVFRCSPAVIILSDPDRDDALLDVSEAFEYVTGYRREEAVGRTGIELGLWADASQFEEYRTRFRSEGRSRNVEIQFRRKNGDVGTGLMSSEWIELDGRMYAISATVDITEQKKAESDMRSLVTAIENAEETIVVTDLEGRIQYCNPAFEAITGYSKEEVLGQNPRILKSGKHVPEFYAEMWAMLAKGQVWRGHLTNKKKDGSFYEEEATISPIRDVKGRITGFVAIKRDVTERLQLEEQFRQAQKLESIGRLAGGMAHDFNNLLTVINGYSDLCLKQLKAADPLKPYVREIQNAGERAANLTKQLLAFSRKQVIEPRILDLNATIRESAPMLQPLIGEDIVLETRLDDSLGQVMADPDQIHQIIMNLAVNARDAMPHGGELTIETANVELSPESSTAIHRDATAGRYVRMSVTDSGHGMDETTRERIFEPFFTTKELGKGTGLGLSTVYGIVRQSGGWIDVRSEVGAGTSFHIFLPRLDAVPAPPRSVTGASIAGGNETILVVEDQPEVRSFTRAALSRYGYNVIDACDGGNAIARASQYANRIDLLVTDVVLPGMNGKEVSERLRLLRPDLKVLFISGYTADLIADRGVLPPGVVFLHKPFSAQELAVKVRDALDSAKPSGEG